MSSLKRKMAAITTTGASLTAASTIVFAAPATAQPAAQSDIHSHSTSAGTNTSGQPQLTVRDILRLNPQAKQVDAYTVQIAKGINLLMPRSQTSGSVTPAVATGCNWGTGWLCVWETSYWGGYGLAFYDCNSDDVNLGYLRYPDGARMSTYVQGQRWNDRISSYDNHQTGGTRANYYDWTGSSWQLVDWSYAPETVSYAENWHDNIIDRVDPC